MALVENLTWKREDSTVVVNPLTHVPSDLDGIDLPAYRYLLRSMFKYRSLANLLPYAEWLHYPITMLLTARGCTQECAICGGSKSAYAQICARPRPAFRSPERLASDVRTIASFSRAPIFVVHDIRMGGMSRAERFLSLLRNLAVDNEIVFELYFPADDRFFDRIARSTARWSAEITLESPDEALRRVNRKWPWPNAVVERTIERALAHGCETLDVFFMMGLPHQRYTDALAIADYCESLLDRFGRGGRLRPFVSPLGPFLDPGSRAFEDPRLGYHRCAGTLEDHRQALLSGDWPHILSYETDCLTRNQIVQASYAAERLNEIKHRHQLIGDATYAGVRDRLRVARALLTQKGEITREQHRALVDANHGTMFGDDELKWPIRHRFRVGATLVKSLALGLVEEIGHTAARMRSRYDDEPWTCETRAEPARVEAVTPP